MKKPNFFIIGAPKCGTTSLAAYLAEHPEIFMSKRKEPFFFSKDDIALNKQTQIYTFSDYNRLFENAGPQHKAIGEASTTYLFSYHAVPNILDYNPQAKFIVMLRNPVDMAYAHHYQLVFSCHQKVKDFKTAWKLQDKLSKGIEKENWSLEPKLLHYGQVCKLGEQLERLYKIAPREQVLVILFDNFKSNTEQVYQQVLDFLDVTTGKRTEFPVYNENKMLHSDWLQNLRRSVRDIKIFLGIKHSFGLFSSLYRKNTTKADRPPLPENFRAELAEYFREDIEKLSRLINFDLLHWK